MAAYAQEGSGQNIDRKGFIFGASIGVSSVHLSFPSAQHQNEISASFPNFKIGAMVSQRTALLLYLPGSIYTYKNESRERARGFEAIVPSVQYWVADRWWVLGGVGLGMDAPAFFDIKDDSERKFYFGGAFVAGVGYDIWRSGRFAIDAQSRIHYGTANIPDGRLQGAALDILIGFNWY